MYSRARFMPPADTAAAALAQTAVPSVALDCSGRIIAVNSSWVDAARAGGAPIDRVGTGVSYLAVCDMAVGDGSEGSAEAAAGIRRVIEGRAREFSMDYPCPGPGGAHWYALRVRPFGPSGSGVVVSHLEITDLKVAETGVPTAEAPTSPLFGRGAAVLALLDAEGRLQHVSESALRALELPVGTASASELVGRLRCHRDDAPRLQETIRRVSLQPGSRAAVTVRIRDGAARWRFLELGVANLLDASDVAAIAISGTDITERHQWAIARSVQSRLLDHVPAALTVLDDEGVVVYWNDRAAELYGYTAEEVLGRRHRTAETVPPGHSAPGAVRAAAREDGRWEGEYRARRKDGSFVPVHLTVEAIDDPRSGFRGLISAAVDISEQLAMRDRLAYEARRDPLTGLPNQLALVEHLEAALEAERAGAGPVAVLMVDLDDFRFVNELMGHDAGDEVIKAVAELFSAAVGSEGFLARVGGDEFVVCVQAAGGPEHAVDAAERILKVLAAPFSVRGQCAMVGATIGVAVSEPGAGNERLLQEADVAMYEAKQSGKNRVRLFDYTLRYRRRRHRHVAADLELAVGTDQIVVHYQPKVLIATAEVVGFEALVRWEHPTAGLMGPDRFVPVAEETGLIGRLGGQVLRQACQALASWKLPRGRALTMAVNASARELATRDFVDQVRAALTTSGIDASQLCIEITESAVAEVRAVAGVLGDLRGLGVSIAIDDFGTGHSSLARLRSLPVDHLKVDRSFVESMLTDPGSRTITAAVIGLAAALGLEVIAEGVEEADQARALLELGCGAAQGFLWSRPVPYDEASRLATRRSVSSGPLQELRAKS